MKNMTTLGEGGMVVTQDAAAAEKMRKIRGFGGDIWGTNYKMTCVQAAVGPRSLPASTRCSTSRAVAAERNELLAARADRATVPEDCWHAFYSTPAWCRVGGRSGTHPSP